MQYELTHHAAIVLMRRGIRASWLSLALESPTQVVADQHDPELVHHLRQIEEFGNRVLRVVLDPRVKPVRIITVYHDRSVKELP